MKQYDQPCKDRFSETGAELFCVKYFNKLIQIFAYYFKANSSIAMEVSDTTMSEESASTASSCDVNSTFDNKSVCQVCCVKGNMILLISLVLSNSLYCLN